jgi:hypothetical protein
MARYAAADRVDEFGECKAHEEGVDVRDGSIG